MILKVSFEENIDNQINQTIIITTMIKTQELSKIFRTEEVETTALIKLTLKSNKESLWL